MFEHKIDILYSEVGNEFSRSKWDYYVKKLPRTIQGKINQYMRWQDRQSSLLGKLLLLDGVMKYGYPSHCLSFISIEKYGRPFLDDNIDFNISHSDGYVICAISDTARLGVDIERVRQPINLSDFEKFIGSDQFNIIRKSNKPYHTFYEFWTKNESVIKADGKGLLAGFSNIYSRGKVALLSGTTWFLKKINIDSGYCCHLATNIEEPMLVVRKICY